MATTALYLDDRVLRKDGCAPLKVVMRNRSTVAHLPLGIAIPPQCWKDGKVVLSKNKAVDALLPAKPLALNTELKTLFAKINLHVTQICGLKSNISAALLRDKVKYALEGGGCDKDTRDITLMECWDEFANAHEKKPTRDAMLIPKSYILKGIKKASSLRLADIDEDWAASVLETLKNGNERVQPLAQNTACHYFNILKAVWHYAQKRKYVPRSENPFFDLHIPKVATRSRALEVEDIRKIWFYDPKQEGDKGVNARTKVVARDMFRLIVCFCGINLADLYELKVSDISNGRLEVDRKKTGVHINIKVEPEAKEIIDRYKKDGYVIGKIRSTSKNATGTKINNGLDKIIPGVTTYWARHSWASIAVELDIPDRTVFMGLAHKQGKLSDETYITMRNRKLDLANRQIIDFILQKGG